MFAKFTIVYLIALLVAFMTVCASASPIPNQESAPAVRYINIFHDVSNNVEIVTREENSESISEPESESIAEREPPVEADVEIEDIDERICRFGCI
ncbi:hypothetical protein SERLA73DRAFT_173267 [Serpula lacrymans var. lacrymans S7.3]|uniref:Secreted protein n=2 Tax=Serpula lacrymans var. lacrymans TaxID=341189 RepID=F8QII9_SERL3|nr:uncharacterized protein SERLADRAFT_447525 [Serpula lacrymans var. lacrymans S7.9]EGN91871.1 hypothetical protein SERLA73DRAFT_173267 [Serpula lacrymans var. lacrymans S7.3]EGO26294.1 hypothetical protein SERLADRAFT_447525 [Serpula lacrymans var. lacrymans S7.9]